MNGTLGGGLAIGSATVAIIGLPRRAPITVLASFVWAAGTIAFAYSPTCQ